MEQFEGRIAVVTGGGSGMGRELVRQLAAQGCHVATCDVSEEHLTETKQLADDEGKPDTRITTFVADVSDEQQMLAFAEAVRRDHDTLHINLLFNNAGVGGGGSFVGDDRKEWDRTFAICWGGVYVGTRAFMPMLLASEEGHVVNTSSVNGFWASLGPNIPHTAYSAAKFAVKGFTEALITDFRLNAPHLRASVVMPGHIGTSIAINSGLIHGTSPKDISADRLQVYRSRLEQMGLDMSGASDEDLRVGMQMQQEMFRDTAPTSAAQAAAIILEGVRKDEWRILVGDDAVKLDTMVRSSPLTAYDANFMDQLRNDGVFNFTQP